MGRLYDTAAWRRLRTVQLARQPLCEECSSFGRFVPATQVDHAISIARGGSLLDVDNLVSLCQSCHSRKTAEMDGAFGRDRRERMRVRGCTPDGRPRDPEHPWRKESRDREAQTPTPPLRVRFRGF